jgi:Na+/H+ antiporter NhaD/arsenite permease-like protein
MERLAVILWGSPVGIAIFFAGLGVLLWGVSKLKLAEAARAEVELKEKQYQHERRREKDG